MLQYFYHETKNQLSECMSKQKKEKKDKNAKMQKMKKKKYFFEQFLTHI